MWLFLVAAAAASSTPPAQAIAEYCANREPCLTDQRTALRHFLGHLAMYDVPQGVAERCMTAGKRGKSVDWTVAALCLRTWAKGRGTLVEKGLGR